MLNITNKPALVIGAGPVALRRAQSLLDAKYVEGLSTKEIAKNRGEAPGTIDNKLTAAKKVARFALEDLFDELRGLNDDDSDLI